MIRFTGLSCVDLFQQLVQLLDNQGVSILGEVETYQEIIGPGVIFAGVESNSVILAHRDADTRVMCTLGKLYFNSEDHRYLTLTAALILRNLIP